MLTAQQLATDEQKLTQSTITLAAFFAFKYVKTNSQVTVKTVLEKLKTAFDGLNLTTPPTDQQLVQAIFQVFHSAANISQVKSIQEIDLLAGDIYGLYNTIEAPVAPAVGTTEPSTFSKLLTDIKSIFKKQPVVDLLKLDDDLNALQGAFVTILGYGLSKLPSNAETTAEIIVTAIKAGIDGINPDTPPSSNDAAQAMFCVLEVTGDFSQKTSIIKIEAIMQNIYQIFGSNTTGNNFIHFFQEIKALIALKKATKAV